MVMKKFLNKPENLTKELLEGYTECYNRQVKLATEKIVVRAEAKSKDKVAILTLGGAGHEPALSGFVGYGMLDASIVGDIFAAPGGPVVYEGLKLFKDYAGIILVVLNHAGDVMNAKMGCMMAQRDGIKVSQILTSDDIAAGVDAPIEDRRGLGGCIPLIKIIGAAAEQGKSVDEILAIGEKFNQRMATLAVTMKTATHPQSGQYISTLPDDKMEIGMGQHGEGGETGPVAIKTADETAEIMIPELIAAVHAKAGEKVVLIVNGSGATTLMEMFLIYRKSAELLKKAGLEIVFGRCDELLTVQESGGFQLFLAVADDEAAKLLAEPSDAPYWVTK
ncbi:MAG: dihydroxyacetone kinase subunit DhaK [Thermoguttaceae bacterium]|nr:dihydroxyacetone kinase subunit DhaK [Thermoguttaceae bacterium]MBQ6620871.1 dihydroxyacetone kinase subunit DhaK [Thermoguttaceae bacterium]MBR2585792.1 dihydroxyacetone kinase subunit DhaK [Thermoguttaceae bacterium]